MIAVERNNYSVLSRLIGEIVEARIYTGHIEVWYGAIIDWLVRKPGAFANYRYREQLFPTRRFRKIYDLLQEVSPPCRDGRYLEILEEAAKEEKHRSMMHYGCCCTPT